MYESGVYMAKKGIGHTTKKLLINLITIRSLNAGLGLGLIWGQNCGLNSKFGDGIGENWNLNFLLSQRDY